ncbi:hypothetical protein BUALT_Bualt11G0084500 [Buddleja alternifolia]|uniref:CCHC-type domain-containing protein n=1 Tax=Buddleja alternifolia TaxID=168488 RepID=A0AAV6WUD9_9LAMI|nr:hypothetical protein BUALT_Bualt11G0084500 [Buddleja alternifolia]
MEQQQNKMIDSSSHEASEVTITPEQGFTAKKPIVDNFENEDLASTSQVAETDMVDATDEFQLENVHESRDTSSSEEEVPEESSKDLMEEDRTGEYNDNSNIEEGTDPQKVSVCAKPEPLFGKGLDIITENRVLRKPIRVPRYFDPPECGSPESDNCDQNNHISERCKAKKKRRTCYICGDIGHDGNRCKKVNGCFICSKKGHLVIDCPKKHLDVDSASRLCLMCGNTGHDMLSCTNGYDSEDLKACELYNIQCYICKKFGHLCCVDSKTEEAREASCYRCGESGHLGFDCIKLNGVANDRQSVPLCAECRESGHSPKECIKCLEATSSKIAMEKDKAVTAKSAKKKARKARRAKKNKSMPADNASQSQPNAADRGWRPHMVGPYYGRPGSNVWLSPAATSNLNHPGLAPGFPSHQVPHDSSFDPMTGLPHLFWNSQNATQIPQNSFYPMTQLPHLIWNANQTPQQPLSHQTGTGPRAETQMALNSLTHPSQLLPRVIYNNQQPTQIVQRPLNHQTGILLPHQLFSNQAGNQNSTSSPSVLVSNPSSASL